jgi:hypothetical protein
LNAKSIRNAHPQPHDSRKNASYAFHCCPVFVVLEGFAFGSYGPV